MGVRTVVSRNKYRVFRNGLKCTGAPSPESYRLWRVWLITVPLRYLNAIANRLPFRYCARRSRCRTELVFNCSLPQPTFSAATSGLPVNRRCAALTRYRMQVELLEGVAGRISCTRGPLQADRPNGHSTLTEHALPGKQGIHWGITAFMRRRCVGNELVPAPFRPARSAVAASI